MRGIILLLIVFNIFSCREKSKTDESIISMSEKSLIDKYGEPKHDTVFILSKELREYQYGLLDIYPNPEEKNIKIKELYWRNSDNNKKMVVWLHKEKDTWQVIDNLIWYGNKIKY